MERKTVNNCKKQLDLQLKLKDASFTVYIKFKFMSEAL